MGVPDIGQNFVSAIIKHVETLAKHLDIDRMVPEFAQANIREIIHPPFRIVYLRGEEVLQTIRIWRSERLLKLPNVISAHF